MYFFDVGNLHSSWHRLGIPSGQCIDRQRGRVQILFYFYLFIYFYLFYLFIYSFIYFIYLFIYLFFFYLLEGVRSRLSTPVNTPLVLMNKKYVFCYCVQHCRCCFQANTGVQCVETVRVTKQSQGQWNNPSLLGGVGHYITQFKVCVHKVSSQNSHKWPTYRQKFGASSKRITLYHHSFLFAMIFL